MKSKKRVKNLEEICLPFLLKPTVPITGGVNGKMWSFFPGQQYEIDYATYEALYHGNYGKQLEN